jgi:hypothetical protein
MSDDFWDRMDARVREMRVAAGMSPEPGLLERFAEWWDRVDGSMVFIIALSALFITSQTAILVARLMLIKLGHHPDF